MTKPVLTPEKLRKGIDEYFDTLPDKTFPDYAGMLLHLGMFPDEVAILCDDERNKRAPEFRRAFQYAELKRESWLARIAASDSKLASGAFNLLKQSNNGGYTTVSKTDKGNALRIIVDGVGGMDAFK